MGFSPLMNERQKPGWYLGRAGVNRWAARPGKVVRFIVHHGATTSAEGIIGSMRSSARELSANYVLKDNRVIGVVDENYRAFTSGSAKADGQAITVEVANSATGGDWPISEASFNTLAKLIADCSIRHGFPINRNTVIGHREVRSKFGQGYATVCPGPWLWARFDNLVNAAQAERQKMLGGGGTPTKPTPVPAPKPAGSDFRIGTKVKLNTPFVRYQRSDLKSRLNPNIPAGTYTVTGISGAAVKLAGNGHEGWFLADGVRAGVLKDAPAPKPAPAPAPAPKPAPKPKTVGIGSVLKLSNWTTYTDHTLRKYLVLNGRRVYLNGSYRVIGIKNGNFRVDAGLGRNNPWVSSKAAAGLQ